jgi:septal ring factor EnvC (AmiA/AmiB activator)
MAGTYSLVQLSSRRHRVSMKSLKRQAAAKVLRAAASKSKNPALAMLATSVELDAFTKVKKAIDDMIATLKVQQEEEVKKNDWCKAEIQENEMATAKNEDKKADLEAKIAELAETIKALEKRIAEAKSEIQELQTELQRATETRIAANLEYQKTVADQTVTIAVLKKALDRLATYYDSAGFLQRRQTPPVPQMEYKPSEGSTGVMQMIEKLIYEAKELMADSKKAESEAQAAYETAIADTNGSVAALQAEVVEKTKAKAETIKEKMDTESDLADTIQELEGLAKYNADLHSECDYLLKNFMLRQEKRADEMEALQQAKQILSGASLS